jgi:hypothetical protein
VPSLARKPRGGSTATRARDANDARPPGYGSVAPRRSPFTNPRVSCVGYESAPSHQHQLAAGTEDRVFRRTRCGPHPTERCQPCGGLVGSPAASAKCAPRSGDGPPPCNRVRAGAPPPPGGGRRSGAVCNESLTRTEGRPAGIGSGACFRARLHSPDPERDPGEVASDRANTCS